MDDSEDTFTFILDSDVHYGKARDNGPRVWKKRNPDNIVLEEDIDFVVVTGDLTENGYNGKKFLGFHYGGFSDQLKAFRDRYVRPIGEANIPLKLCIGNHDRGRPPYLYQPVFCYVKKRYGGIKYTFDHKGFRFICCGMYPKDTKWLRKRLSKEKHNIIYFHYNVSGAYSDWWSKKAKKRFVKTVKGYPIAAVLVGHDHVSRQYEWEGLNIVMAAGEGYARVTCDSSDGSAEAQFKRDVDH